MITTLAFVTILPSREIVEELYKEEALTGIFPCGMLPLNTDTMSVSSNLMTMLVRRTPDTPAAFVDANEDRVYKTKASFLGSEREFAVTITVSGRAASTESAIFKVSPDAMEIQISMMEEQ